MGVTNLLKNSWVQEIIILTASDTKIYIDDH